MRILFFLGLPNPFPGAAWTRVGFFASCFKRKGHQTEVAGVFSPRSLGKAGSSNWRGIKLVNICPTLQLRNPLSLSFNILSSTVMLSLLVFFLRPDLVVISVPDGEPAFGAYLASRLVRAKVLIDYRDEWEDYIINGRRSRISISIYRFFKTLMTRIYLRSDRVLTVTDAFKRSLLARGLKQITVVPNGADTTVFKPHDRIAARRKIGLPKDDFVLVYSGGIGGYYRIDVIVAAMAKLHPNIRSKTKLLIVGDERASLGILGLSKKLLLSGSIVRLGFMRDEQELAEALSAADVGIIPYDGNPLWRNSLPAKFFEYCACELPVIATVYGDSVLAKLIRDHHVGLCSDPMNTWQLAGLLVQMYTNRKFRERAGVNARLLAEKLFDRNRITLDLIQLAESLV